MKRSDKVIRDRLLVENYIKRKMMGHTEIVKKLWMKKVREGQN